MHGVKDDNDTHSKGGDKHNRNPATTTAATTLTATRTNNNCDFNPPILSDFLPTPPPAGDEPEVKQIDDGVNRCGIDGSKQADKHAVGSATSVFSLIPTPHESDADLYSVYERKLEGKSTVTCDNYFLFDKILDKDGKKGEKEKDKRITLGDMCPKQCHKKVCKP